VVVTLDSLQGFSIEDFGYQLGRNWGIGQKGKNTGALLIVVPKEHKVRIEVGYGLEGQLTGRDQPHDYRERTSCRASSAATSTPASWPHTSILKALGGTEDLHRAPPNRPRAHPLTMTWIGVAVILFVAIWLIVIILRRRMGSGYGHEVTGYYGGGGFPSGGGGAAVASPAAEDRSAEEAPREVGDIETENMKSPFTPKSTNASTPR